MTPMQRKRNHEHHSWNQQTTSHNMVVADCGTRVYWTVREADAPRTRQRAGAEPPHAARHHMRKRTTWPPTNYDCGGCGEWGLCSRQHPWRTIRLSSQWALAHWAKRASLSSARMYIRAQQDNPQSGNAPRALLGSMPEAHSGNATKPSKTQAK